MTSVVVVVFPIDWLKAFLYMFIRYRKLCVYVCVCPSLLVVIARWVLTNKRWWTWAVGAFDTFAAWHWHCGWQTCGPCCWLSCVLAAADDARQTLCVYCNACLSHCCWRLLWGWQRLWSFVARLWCWQRQHLWPFCACDCVSLLIAC